MSASLPPQSGERNPIEDVAAPGWFTAALDARPEIVDVDVDGHRVCTRVWGETWAPPLVLVHGGAAHSGWWDHIAPFLASTHRVIAPDLSGHGDSDTRSHYELAIWAREIIVASRVLGGTTPSILVGHSMGGLVAAMAATNHRDQIDGVVVIDSPLQELAPEVISRRIRREKPPGYPSLEHIVTRFRAVPEQEVTLPYVVRHIARESVVRTDAGWEWKFDRSVLERTRTSEEVHIVSKLLTEMPCSVAYMRCAEGLVSFDMAGRIGELMQHRGLFIELPAAGHHPMLDQPLALVAALRTLLAVWHVDKRPINDSHR